VPCWVLVGVGLVVVGVIRCGGGFHRQELKCPLHGCGITMPTSLSINLALFKPANASIYLAVVENFSYFICRNCMVGAVHSISSLISVILIL
jgi:hypothetical protein